MTIEQSREALRNAQNELAQMNAKRDQILNDKDAGVDTINAMTNALRAQRAKITDLEEELAYQEGIARRAPMVNAVKPEEKTLNELRKSREYARAFAAALRDGASPNRPMASERLKPLYDALTISGGTVAGEDGGFLVPEDVDHTINEILREEGDIAALFGAETVTTNSGWRVIDTAPTTGFTALTGEATANAVKEDDQPDFAKVPYSLTTYGLNLPASRELMADEDANLMGYIARWGAKKLINTHRQLLMAKLDTLTSSAETFTSAATALASLKKLLNVSLDPAISRNAVFLTNQDGFNAIDSLVDSTGRPLLQYDTQDPTRPMFAGRRIVTLSNAQLATTASKPPLYVGDFKRFATLFSRAPMEVASTEVGGAAWRSNAVEVRFIVRKCASIFDKGAALRRTLTLTTG